MKSKVIVELEVSARKDEDDAPSWSFAISTLKFILDSILSSRTAKRWDYRFKVIKVFRVDEETRVEHIPFCATDVP